MTNANPSRRCCSSSASKRPPGSGRSTGYLRRPARRGRPTTTPTTGKSPASPPTSTSSTKRSPTKKPQKTGKASPNPSKRNSPNSRTPRSPPPPRKGTHGQTEKRCRTRNPRRLRRREANPGEGERAGRQTRRRHRTRQPRNRAGEPGAGGGRRVVPRPRGAAEESAGAPDIHRPGRAHARYPRPARRPCRRALRADRGTGRADRGRNRQSRRPRRPRLRLQRAHLATRHPRRRHRRQPGRTRTGRGNRMSAPEPAQNATPAELEYAADPLSRELVREDLVDQTCKKLVDILDKQIRPNLTQAEYAKVIERAKKELDGGPLEEMAY